MLQNTESTSPGPAVVLRSVGSERGPPVECNSLIGDVAVEKSVSDFTVFGRPTLSISSSFWLHISREQPQTKLD